MVRHVILWKLKEMPDAEKAAVKAGIKEGLEGLAGKIPGLLDVRVYTDAPVSYTHLCGSSTQSANVPQPTTISPISMMVAALDSEPSGRRRWNPPSRRLEKMDRTCCIMHTWKHI